MWRFGVFEVDASGHGLRRSGVSVKIREQPFRVLVYLLEHAGEVVSREELCRLLWPADTFVDFDHSLNTAMMNLRDVLGDAPDAPIYIETIPKRGYRFIAAVREVQSKSSGAASQMQPEASVVVNDRPTLPVEPAAGFQEKSPPSSGSDSAPSRRMLFAGVAASILTLIAFALIWRTIGKKAGPNRSANAYPLTEQRVTSNPPEDPVQSASISPDNKYLAYSDPTGLYLRELSTGETRKWNLPQGFVGWPNSWFPDGTHLLVRRIEGQPLISHLQKSSLYKLSLLGGPPQMILDNAAAGSVSPDGTKIAYLRGPNFGSELWVVNADGTNARELTWAGVLPKPGLHNSWIKSPAWSPGGKRIAYFEGHETLGSDPNESSGSLMTIEPNGSGLNEAWNDSRVGDALWWAPDGRILFAYREDPSSKKQDYGVYSIRLDEGTGKATEPPQLITRSEGMIAKLNSTADSKRLSLLRTEEVTKVFIARFDTRARQFQQPRRLVLDENGNYATAWTADSAAVLFVSNRDGVWRLFKQGIDETTPETVVEAPSITLPRLSPDGSEVLYLTPSRQNATLGLVSMMGKPLAGGPPHLVVQDKGIINYGCARAPSQRCVFSKVDGQDLIFISYEVKDGAPSREIVKMKNDIWNWVISPDGSKLAMVCDSHRIRFLSLENGSGRDVTVQDWPLYAVDWSADSQTLFMPSMTAEGTPVILEVDQAGHAHVALHGPANTGFSSMIQSPDGQYGLLLEWTQAANNVWMVENF
jgi:DNA-binding winged helix-turn-helix (wHTH) protein/Tol biopolymer transport system component